MPAANSGFVQAGVWVFIGNGQCLHFSPIFQLFSFSLFGIFVNISNKNPRLTQSRRDVSRHTNQKMRIPKMRIPTIIKRIGNYFFALILAIGCIFAGVLAIETSKLNLNQLDVFTGKIIEKGITSNSSNVSGKGEIRSDVFFVKLEGLNQILATYNPKKDYEKLNQSLSVGDIIKVYFRKSNSTNKANIATFQIEKNNEIILNKDDYQSREGIAGYFMIIGGIVLVGLAVYGDRKHYWKKK
ncbi:hypothetical protein FEDK69T_30140 [Flavobacterium enshiense DK69]|uniref:Uncharacterized protein n=1 Tax=Flavobacterium enshiense DK69 TaxID=1107311 RepID=V6S262_9FLAO|nr:hypothetical protein [Flavobacterium enshiense]ESU20489.1 hypothetical protein FEDK69T_30140 [Flavobacterium enshiense DK69]KGO95965.1 hypothetical protein Q767_08420 [Flavobacterium enshiense DK69]